MKKQRILATVLLLFVSICTLAGCGGGKEPAATTGSEVGTTSSSSAPAESATTAATTDSEVGTTSSSSASAEAATTEPEIKTFDGYEFVIAGERGFVGNTFFVTQATNALENRQIRAYEALEDGLDVVINFMRAKYDTVLANAAANKATGDFVHFRHQYWIPLAVKGYIQPLNTDAVKAAGLDVSDPEQVDIYQTNVSRQLDGENVWAFAVSGEYFSAPWGHGLTFNKKLCENAGYPAEDIYQMVRDHAWTWDKFEEICRAVSDNRIEGIGGYSVSINDMVEIASNVSINARTEDGRWMTNIGSDEFIQAFNWTKKIIHDRDVCIDLLYHLYYGHGHPRYAFYDGEQGFIVFSGNSFGFGKDMCNLIMTEDYGYVPFPMGPDATEYSHVIPDLFGFSLETTNKDVETSVYIMGKFASLLNDPDQYVVYARGVMRDDESVEMIMDYMLPNATLNTACLSYETEQIVENLITDVFSAKDTEDVCDIFGRMMQVEIDKLFGYGTDSSPNYVYLNGADEMSLEEAYNFLEYDQGDLAEEMGYVTHLNGDILSGTEKWEEFMRLAQEGIPSVIRVVMLDSPSYEGDRTAKTLYDITFDGEFYRYKRVSMYGNAERAYAYLTFIEQTTIPESDRYEQRNFYILTNRRVSSALELFWSSDIGYDIVWNDYIYKEQYKDSDATYGR